MTDETPEDTCKSPPAFLEALAAQKQAEAAPFVAVRRVTSVREAPGADNLTLVTLEGVPDEAVANKREDGSWRYQPNALAVVFPEGAILDESLLRQMGYWDEAKKRGLLAGGSKRNRVKMQRFAGYESRVALMPVAQTEEGGIVNDGLGNSKIVRDGEDVTEFLRVGRHVAE